MTPAQRRTRFRCLRRSRRGLKKLSSELSKTKTQKQNRHNGLAKNCVRQKSESTQTLAQHCEWKRLAKQIQHLPFEITLPLVHDKRFRDRTDAAMIRQWKRWEMKHPSNHGRMIHHPKQNEHFKSTFCWQCWPYTVLTLRKPPNIDWESAATRTPKRHRKRQQPQCNTARPNADTATLPPNDGDDCPNPRYPRSLKNATHGWTKHPSSAQQTFRKHQKLKHQSQLAKSTSSRWRLFELEDGQSKDALEQTLSQHDTTLETSLRRTPEYERPTPPTEMPRFAVCHGVRLIDLSFVPKQAPLCGMRRMIIHTRRKHEHHVFWKFFMTKLFRQRLSSRRQQMFTHGHTPWREHEARTLK